MSCYSIWEGALWKSSGVRVTDQDQLLLLSIEWKLTRKGKSSRAGRDGRSSRLGWKRSGWQSECITEHDKGSGTYLGTKAVGGLG